MDCTGFWQVSFIQTAPNIIIARFVDPEDQLGYLYTYCEPFSAHRFFACFDQVLLERFKNEFKNHIEFE